MNYFKKLINNNQSYKHIQNYQLDYMKIALYFIL